MHINFWPLHGHRRMCPGLEFVLTKRWRTLMSYSGHISLLGNVFPCSRLDVYFLVLSKHVHQRASGQPPAVSVSCRRRARSFGCSISHLPVSAAGWDPLAMGDWHHWSWSCSVSSLYESSIVPSSAYVSRVFLGDPNIYKPCKRSSELTAPAASGGRQLVSLAQRLRHICFPHHHLHTHFLGHRAENL